MVAATRPAGGGLATCSAPGGVRNPDGLTAGMSGGAGNSASTRLLRGYRRTARPLGMGGWAATQLAPGGRGPGAYATRELDGWLATPIALRCAYRDVRTGWKGRVDCTP